METFFYFCCICFIIYEIANFYGAAERHATLARIKALPSEMRMKDKAYMGHALANTVYAVWCIGGLITFQWPAFASILLLSFVGKPYVWVRKVDAFITAGILIFVLVNKYHFHIDLWEQMRTFFS